MVTQPLRCGCNLQINTEVMDGPTFTNLCIEHYKNVHGLVDNGSMEDFADKMEEINKQNT
jgi:hypothetical protein